jgi:hypothetical protein
VFKRLFAGLILATLSLCIGHASDAATLVLVSGQKIEGRIIEQTPLHITLDVYGSPITYYLGEISTIDGQEIEVPLPQSTGPAIVEEKKSPPPASKKEEDSLVKFMAIRHANVPKAAPSPKAPPTPSKETEKKVIPTSDGGIIVVGSEKIAKYDKNLNIIKEIKLKPDNAGGSN